MAASFVALAQELKECPRNLRPHVVVLGAGASCAAFPDGDANGRRLPVMNNFVDIVGLQSLLAAGAPELQDEKNIEEVYPQLLSDPNWTDVAREVEQRIHQYFAEMTLPDCATIYDRLVLSLRPMDTILTFNWDPFLSDAMARNAGVAPLPFAFYLHGNVRLGTCSTHPQVMTSQGPSCHICGKLLTSVPLLYPVRDKNYNQDPVIHNQWNLAKERLAGALAVTIFGYGAPESDVEAIKLMHTAWYERSTREFEHIEIIDTADSDALHSRWAPFAPTLHLNPVRSFSESHIARWPRRVSESWAIPMSEARPCEDFPLPSADDLALLQSYCGELAWYE